MSVKTNEAHELIVDFIACDGYGICADILPDNIRLDDWGYPIVTDEGVPPHLMKTARRAVRRCPVLALRVREAKARHH